MPLGEPGPSPSILIVGAGIGGLTSAIALRQRGFAVELIERDPDWSVYGVGIIQQSNVVRAVASLGILDDYLHAGFGFNQVRMYAPNGAPIVTLDSPRLAGLDYPANIGISRPGLQKVLAERTQKLGAAVRLGVTATALDDDGTGVNAVFSDGTSARYDIVIGADGLYSQTRGEIFPDLAGPRFTGQAVWRYNFPRDPDVDALLAYEGRIGVGLVPLSDTTMYMYVTTREPGNPRLPREGSAAAMRARLSEAAPRLQALVPLITDDDAVVYKPLYTLFNYGDWYKGRIVLIGDALHGATPHLGQGAGMAIEDSIVLAEELSNHSDDPSAAFAAYQARRFERCRTIVESSNMVGDYQLGLIEHLDYSALNRRIFEVTAEPI